MSIGLNGEDKKTQKEKDFFSFFKRVYGMVPDGTIEFIDKPDVKIQRKDGGILGVEITECYHSREIAHDGMRDSEFQVSFNDFALEFFASKLDFNFVIDIELDKTNSPRRRNFDSIINELYDKIGVELIGLRPYECVRFCRLGGDWQSFPPTLKSNYKNQGFRDLPAGINKVHLARFNFLDQPFHPNSKGGVIPDFSANDLLKILEKKHEKLRQYSHCDEYWLVIFEGHDFYSCFRQIVIDEQIETKFDKVMMCRIRTSEVLMFK